MIYAHTLVGSCHVITCGHYLTPTKIPWADQPLQYHLKFRIWSQIYNASYHKAVRRTSMGDLGAGPSGSGAEFDVPKCAEGIMGCKKRADGTWVHTIRSTFTASGSLVAHHGHCHAPTCLSMALYRCDKSVKVCNATTGELLCNQEPVYGGSGKVPNKNMNEKGFILQPPCIWGDPEFGLEPPVKVDGYTLHNVKTSNANYGHHGEMAHPQVYVV